MPKPPHHSRKQPARAVLPKTEDQPCAPSSARRRVPRVLPPKTGDQPCTDNHTVARQLLSELLPKQAHLRDTLEQSETSNHELQTLNEKLHSMNEKLHSMNEELQSMNEEQQSMNEELRSTTEELEKSREELQSSNGELTKVNAELKGKVDELARSNGDLQNLKDAAVTANQTKDRFLAVLSHELRTPLTPVLMAVAALEHDPELRADVREDLTMIRRNIELETKLIDDLLDLSRITNGKVALHTESVDLNEAVQHVCEMCRSHFQEQNVRLEIQLGEHVCHITADRARLQQVLWNVIKNAVKFTPEGGTVRVASVRAGPGRCAVRVQDSGIGIAPEVLPSIFAAFEQGEAHITQQFGGLGLGLAISRALIELHGGTIRAESEGLGKGATFTIELPGPAPAPASNGTACAAPADSTTPLALRLLLVEDHADTARTLSRLLRGKGFEVTTAADVASGIAASEREPFDLVVSDLGLPDGSGYDVLRAIRARRAIPGIAMSGYGMEEDLRRSREAGFAEHLVKPINVVDLIAAIRRVRDRG